jgi:hypothetical protein
LGDAPARGEWRLGVEDFADQADAGLGEMRFEAVERRAAPAVIPSCGLSGGSFSGSVTVTVDRTTVRMAAAIWTRRTAYACSLSKSLEVRGCCRVT